MNETVGISILTNGARRHYLQNCINSFLKNCAYRPLIIGIFDNGSTDDTKEFLNNLPQFYGVEFRTMSEDTDCGCAYGTNESIEMVSDCTWQIHLESDFEHLSRRVTNIDCMWLHRALRILKDKCSYLYLRRMRSHDEAGMHWWDQWMPKIKKEIDDEYLYCPEFWWSNNPALFKLEDLKSANVLP